MIGELGATGRAELSNETLATRLLFGVVVGLPPILDRVYFADRRSITRDPDGRVHAFGPSDVRIRLAGLRVSLAIALILAVVTEMQASLPGLGGDIFYAQRIYRSADLYAALIVLGAMGLAANQLLIRIEAPALRWRGESLGATDISVGGSVRSRWRRQCAIGGYFTSSAG